MHNEVRITLPSLLSLPLFRFKGNFPGSNPAEKLHTRPMWYHPFSSAAASELQILPRISCHRRRDILRYGYCDDPPFQPLRRRRQAAVQSLIG